MGQDPAKVISFINLKGGVGKTTTTIGTAMALADTYKKRVLVIDLDPQTNATVMLIGEEKWKELDDNGYTLNTLFEDEVDEKNNFSLENTIQKGVGNIKDVDKVDLLPCSVKLMYLQDYLASISNRRDYCANPNDVFINKLGTLKYKYDYILIDCPPQIGILTFNGLKFSDAYIIPTIPDFLSTYGLPQIVNRIDIFSSNSRIKLKCLGVVLTKVQQTSLHREVINTLKITTPAPLFETQFEASTKYAQAAEYSDDPMTLRQKWGYLGSPVDKFNKFAKEIMERLNTHE